MTIQTINNAESLLSVRTKMNANFAELDSGKQDDLWFTPEDTANKSTNITTDGASDTKYPSAKAVKTYADSLVVGLLDDRGSYDASGNTFPASGGSGAAGAIMKGDLWYISVGGTLGGVTVAIGDSVRAIADTPGQTAGNWSILEANMGYVPENTANKGTAMSGNTTSNIVFLSAKAVYDWGIATFATLAGSIAQTFAVLTLELGHATDTTISRVSAGVAAIEGATIATLSTIQTWTALQTHKQINWTNNAITASSNAATVPITHRFHTVTNNSAGTLTITMTTTSAVDWQLVMVRVLDASGVAQTITWVNTENSDASVPTTSNGSTTLPKTVWFSYNGATSKWRCIVAV